MYRAAHQRTPLLPATATNREYQPAAAAIAAAGPDAVSSLAAAQAAVDAAHLALPHLPAYLQVRACTRVHVLRVHARVCVACVRCLCVFCAHVHASQPWQQPSDPSRHAGREGGRQALTISRLPGPCCNTQVMKDCKYFVKDYGGTMRVPLEACANSSGVPPVRVQCQVCVCVWGGCRWLSCQRGGRVLRVCRAALSPAVTPGSAHMLCLTSCAHTYAHTRMHTLTYTRTRMNTLTHTCTHTHTQVRLPRCMESRWPQLPGVRGAVARVRPLTLTPPEPLLLSGSRPVMVADLLRCVRVRTAPWFVARFIALALCSHPSHHARANRHRQAHTSTRTQAHAHTSTRTHAHAHAHAHTCARARTCRTAG